MDLLSPIQTWWCRGPLPASGVIMNNAFMERPQLSLIIPAYNESRYITTTLLAAQRALEESRSMSHEIIVADDDSTDGTAAIAESLGARVIFSGKRNIGATRNVGAKAAEGKILLFVDADTQISSSNIDEVLNAIQHGAIAGGAPVDWIEPASRLLRYCARGWNAYSRLTKSPAGSFFFVLREAFEKVGGFDEEFFVSEEIHLGRKLKKIGQVIIIPTPVRTSPRKEKDFTLRDHLLLLGRMIIAPRKTFLERTHLEIWYTRKGNDDEVCPNSTEAPRKA